jgi:hypothetical protein
MHTSKALMYSGSLFTSCAPKKWILAYLEVYNAYALSSGHKNNIQSGRLWAKTLTNLYQA